eukprot:TRINITY_DN1728_c2_g1_i1.p1 TRINITY_DN1728_c2_g1~~TRINITY_DN1728_c2_g1_i1.p1  ORF type:complete len:726 (+),score=190.68 TRINITY_DN1728_c2_g1_i1:24-2201(+)
MRRSTGTGGSLVMRRLCFEVLAAACASALPFDLAHSELQVCSGGVCEVERSAANEVRRLVATHKATHVEAVIARSYAGHEWEGLFPSPLSGIHCTASKCTLPLGDAYTYKLLRATVTPPAGTAHTTARLLSQGTFGVRKADIDAFSAAGGDDADASAAWFDAQVAAPPTLAQAYTRARQNPRHNSKTVGATYKPCGKGARYHAYAFATRDVGQALRVSKSNGVFVLKLSGVALTEVAEWAPGTGTFEICTVAEAFGDDGGVGVAAAGKCKNDAVRVPNPPVAFADSSGIVSVEADAVHVLTMRQMTFVLKRDQPSCTAFENADAVNAADLHFIKLGGAVHRYDRRLKLFANTPEAPSTEDAGEVSPGLCPAAAPTFMNAWQCRRGASPCAAAACGARGEVRWKGRELLRELIEGTAESAQSDRSPLIKGWLFGRQEGPAKPPPKGNKAAAAPPPPPSKGNKAVVVPPPPSAKAPAPVAAAPPPGDAPPDYPTPEALQAMQAQQLARLPPPPATIKELVKELAKHRYVPDASPAPPAQQPRKAAAAPVRLTGLKRERESDPLGPLAPMRRQALAQQAPPPPARPPPEAPPVRAWYVDQLAKLTDCKKSLINMMVDAALPHSERARDIVAAWEQRVRAERAPRVLLAQWYLLDALIKTAFPNGRDNPFLVAVREKIVVLAQDYMPHTLDAAMLPACQQLVSTWDGTLDSALVQRISATLNRWGRHTI